MRSTDDALPQRAALSEPFWSCVLLLGIAVRLVLAFGTDVYFDEAYYWTWSQQLAAGYFDHSPLIAWFIALFGVRGTALLAGFATIAVVFGFARDVFGGDPRAGLRAAALYATVPAAVLAGFIATPDSLLLLFWGATLWALWREQWLIAGLLAGVAFLSKYNAVLLGPVFLLLCARERRFPRGIWITLLVAMIVGSPLVIWNALNEWVGFGFQLRHGLGGKGGLASFGEFLGGQFAMAGPVLLVAGVSWAVRGERRQLLLRLAFVVPLVFFGFAAWRTRGEANWAAMAYVSACVGLAGGAPRVLKAAAISGALICVLGAVHLVFPFVELKRDVPLQRLQGWSELAQLAERKPAAVFAPTYQLASEVAYYARLPTDVMASHRPTQFDLWPALEIPEGAPVLWVSEGPPPPGELASRFSAVTGPESLLGVYRGRTLHEFKVWTLRSGVPAR